MQAAIYARYSSELQSDTSIDGQERLCRARAAREGWTVVGLHADCAVSGTVPVAARAGGRQLLADVVLGSVQVLLLEGLDRLSRDQVEQERVVRRLEYHGVRIVGVSDGYDSTSSARKVLRGVRGLINELFLDDLGKKVHRGMAGAIHRGHALGVPPYGYRLVRCKKGSQHEIVEEAAHWVRFVFERFVAGDSIVNIAYRLNELGVPSPAGQLWDACAIYGSPLHGSGLLNRTLYAGRVCWNRSKMVRDPDTGRRHSVPRPREEWIVVERPELRIIDEETWQAAQARIHAGRNKDGVKPKGRPARALLSGALRCPHCGAGMVAVSSARYGCSARLRHGDTACHGYLIRRDAVDPLLLKWVRDELATPEAAQAYEAAFQGALAAGQPKVDAAALQQRVRALEGEVRNLVNAVASLGALPALASRLQKAEAELAGLRTQLAALRSPPAPGPAARAFFAQQLENLAAVLAREPARARAALRPLLASVELEVRSGQVRVTRPDGKHDVLPEFVAIRQRPPAFGSPPRRRRVSWPPANPAVVAFCKPPKDHESQCDTDAVRDKNR